MWDAMMPDKPGHIQWRYASGRLLVESRRFIWLPRWLPVVDRKNWWDCQKARFLWLRWATLRGTDFGWETVVE